jgi:hypothetical protein
MKHSLQIVHITALQERLRKEKNADKRSIIQQQLNRLKNKSD